MRSVVVGLGLGALVIGSFGYPAIAAKSKMGCEVGKEIWNASAGKCEPGTYKWSKKPGKKVEKATAKKAPEKK